MDVLLLFIIVLQGHLEDKGTSEDKGTFVPEFLSLLVNILSCEAHINIAGGDCAVPTGNYL